MRLEYLRPAERFTSMVPAGSFDAKGASREEISSLFPGQGRDFLHDVAVRDLRDRELACLIQRDVLAQRRARGERRFAIPHSFAPLAHGRGLDALLFIHEDWWELIRATASELTTECHGTLGDLAGSSSHFSALKGQRLLLVRDPCGSPQDGAARELVEKARQAGLEIAAEMELQEAEADRPPKALFRKASRKKPFYPPLLIAAASVIASAIILVGSLSNANRVAAELARQNVLKADSTAKLGGAGSESAKAMEEAMASRFLSEPYDSILALSGVAKAVAGKGRIIQFRLEGKKLFLEMEGPSSGEARRLLEAEAGLIDAKLSVSSYGTDGTERFSITGALE